MSFALADLPGATLGLATDRHITLDQSAAGYGWFVDATPNLDEEFVTSNFIGPQTRNQIAPPAAWTCSPS